MITVVPIARKYVTPIVDFAGNHVKVTDVAFDETVVQLSLSSGAATSSSLQSHYGQ